MRAFDLSPLFRQTVGFDRLIDTLSQSGGLEPAPNYPPYNIERTAENAYRVTLAVAGFAREDLSIETRENALTIRGAKETPTDSESREFLHQGIAARAFERRFQLADHVVATGAVLENGLLHVDLVREIPEAQKPRRIEIGGVGPRSVEAGAAPTKPVEVKAA
jgi:molecular chaperone IbpA